MVAACVHDPEAPDNKPEVPLVSVDESSVTRVSMLVKGQFGGDMSSVTSYGVEISDELFEAGGTYQTLVPQDVTAEGFSVGVTGLKANTTYYLRSFISNGHSKMYSNTLAQKTPESSVASVSDVSVSEFYLTAVIEDDGGREITDLGFVWGTSSQRESIRRERRIPATLDKDGKTFALPLSLLGDGTHYVLAYAEDDKSGTGFSRILCKVVINDEDEVDIEDPKFKEYLLDNHDLNVNGKISFGELTAISNIDAVTDEIASVREVAGMPLLESLNARGSEPRKGKLKSIPLGSNSSMTAVDCSNNQLTGLDLSNSTGLRSLNVSGNDLPTLNCSTLMDLKYLNCLDNPNLATLYLSIAQDIEVLLVPDYTEIIYVDAPAVTGLTLERTSAAMVRGETLELLVTLQPDDAYLKSVLWTSDNPDVATVDGNGIITAISAGTATITAKAGKITATCAITVTVPVSSVTLDKTTLALTEGETYKLTATVSPEDATNQGISWRSSDSRVATVDDNGLVTAIGAGTATVTVTMADGGLTATCEVTVARKIIHVTGVELSNTTLRIIKGNTETLTATVLPADATDKSITWASTNQGIAQVEQNGRVTGVETGSATVYVTTTDGEFVAACEVTVYVPFVDVTSITLDRTTAAMVKGETLTLTATVLPEDATVKTVSWTSDNPDVAKVDDDGNVTAVGGGSATISAQAGNFTATCNITVTVPVSSVTLDKTTLGLTEGETYQLTATVNPEDATNQGISWRSNDTRVATVDDRGLVTSIGEGTATVTVTTADGDHTATCEVTVARRIIHVTGVELSSTTLRVIKGSTETLTATVLPADATDKGVTWSSTNQNIAQVEQNGRVTGVETGSATVYVTTSDGEFVAACEVTVYVPFVDVTSITLDRTTAAMVKGKTLTLTATVLPEDASVKTVTWTSENPDVAKVDDDGNVTAVGGGSAIITAQAGDFTATCTVTVTVPVSSVTLDKTTLALTEGETDQLTATVNPEDATNQGVSWRSSDTDVATVTNSGLVTAIGEGTATVTVTTADGDHTATCEVTVARRVIHVTGVELSSTTMRVIRGTTEVLNATVLPADATNKGVIWSSTNQNIVQVDQSGFVTGVETGTATVYVTTSDGGYVATCEVTVYVPYVEVTSITLDRTSAAMVKGETLTLTATVLPDNASVKTVTWTSDSPNVATVDNNGLVTATGGGSATITAQAGDFTATCTVTVTVPVSSVTLDKTTLALTVGDTDQLTATVNPEDATNQGVSWRSSNTGVATVGNNGLVTAIGAGTATITVTTSDGSFTASCEVTVTENISHDDVLYPTARIVDFEYGSDFTGNQLQHTFTDNDALTLYPITTTVGDGVYFSVYENQGSSCVLYGNDYALKDGEQYVAYGSYMSDMVPEATEVPLYYDSQEQLSKGAWMPTDKDYLYSSRTAPYNGGCEFELQHLGALLVMDVTFKEEGICRELMLTAPEEVFILYGTVNLLANPVEITPVETTSTTWLSLGGEDGISFEENETVRMAMMIAPVDLSGKTLNMEIYGGDNYLTGRVTGQNFQAGKAYLIKATVGPIYGWENDFNWVDIGLSVKWATNNVGTFSAEEYGDYYAWGATDPHYESLDPLTWKEGFGAGYTWTNCPYTTGGETVSAQFSKYNANDNKTTLDLTDDVAREIWGGGWRMPTAAEFEELIATRNNEANYLWEWTEMNGIAGWQIIYFGNENSIFLPAAGTWSGTDSNNAGSQGAYWSSSLYTGDRSNARGLYFNANGVSSYTYDRSMGLSVRPVIE